jgi:hypothetical protein
MYKFYSFFFKRCGVRASLVTTSVAWNGHIIIVGLIQLEEFYVHYHIRGSIHLMLSNAGDPCQWTYVMNLEKKKKNQPWSSIPQHFLLLVKFRQEDKF